MRVFGILRDCVTRCSSTIHTTCPHICLALTSGLERSVIALVMCCSMFGDINTAVTVINSTQDNVFGALIIA